MKKIGVGVMVAVFGLLMAGALYADNIGYIDMDRLLMNYKEADKLLAPIKVKREEYQKSFEEKQRKLEEARRAGKKEEEIQKMVAKMEAELKPKQEELMRLEGETQKQLLGKIVTLANKVGKEYGIDVVLDKRVIYSGGFDLTDFILDRLNK